jgi:hypothetical protein
LHALGECGVAKCQRGHQGTEDPVRSVFVPRGVDARFGPVDAGCAKAVPDDFLRPSLPRQGPRNNDVEGRSQRNQVFPDGASLFLAALGQSIGIGLEGASLTVPNEKKRAHCLPRASDPTSLFWENSTVAAGSATEHISAPRFAARDPTDATLL